MSAVTEAPRPLFEVVTQHFALVFYFDLGRYLIAAGLVTLVLWAGGRWLELYPALRRPITAARCCPRCAPCSSLR